MTNGNAPTIEDLYAADQAWRTARAEIEEEIRRKTEERLADLRATRDKLAYRVHTERGVSKRKIAIEGLSTKASITAYEAIIHGAALLGVDLDRNPVVGVDGRGNPSKPKATVIAWRGSHNQDAGTLIVTLGDDDYAKALKGAEDPIQSRDGIFLAKRQGASIYVDPHTLDLTIPAVWLFVNDADFANRVEDYAESLNN